MKKLLSLNNIRNIKVIEAAVSDNNGSLIFLLMKVTEFQVTWDESLPDGNLVVKTVSLDKLYKQKEISIPNYIKIDVEGAEMLVFLGAEKILFKIHPDNILSHTWRINT